MRKSIFFIILSANFIFPAIFVFAGNETRIKEFSITAYRKTNAQSQVPVTIRGDNLDVNGFYNPTFAPRACQPCSDSDAEKPRLNGSLDLNSSNQFSGYINGIFYPEIFPGGMLDYNVGQTVGFIPQSWSKSIRLTLPATLKGDYIGFWTSRNDVDNLNRAVFVEQNINLSGFAGLTLFWYLSSNNRRLYEDKTLSYIFSKTE